MARSDRYHSGDNTDQRNAFQRDRDRLLYCSAFRRLAEVTQVVSAAEGHSFHNRLTHSLKVGQIARRLAEKLIVDQPTEADALGLHPEVAEAAALAHDLGHPPFGHLAEEELNSLAKEEGINGGFEGNAQSFRIVTKLAIRTENYPGLNLTAATLNGILKYPWFRQKDGESSRKWGVYESERAEFQWARSASSTASNTRTVEAELMDWADDIAYSVFDVDDFYRAGLIPLDQVFASKVERDRFLESAGERLKKWKKDPKPILSAFEELVETFPPMSLKGQYQGTTDQRALLRDWTSRLVARYVHGISLALPENTSHRCIRIEQGLKNEVDSLKQLVWHYVIESDRLLTQQHGERMVIRSLFGLFMMQIGKGNYDIFGEPCRRALRAIDQSAKSGDWADDKIKEERVRVVIDLIASMTESQAVRLNHRLTGVAIGSIHDHF
jgi:dGTPase